MLIIGNTFNKRVSVLKWQIIGWSNVSPYQPIEYKGSKKSDEAFGIVEEERNERPQIASLYNSLSNAGAC